VVPGDRRGRSEHESDESASQGRSKGREDGLSDDERHGAGCGPDEQSAKDACSAMVGGKARGHAGEEGQRADGEIENQPAQKADAGHAENDADDNLVAYSTTRLDE